MSTKTAASTQRETDDSYYALELSILNRVAEVTATGEPIFTTNVSPDELWRAYLTNIPADRRQHYNCHCCRRFIQKYGGLVTIDAEGDAHPLLWWSFSSPPTPFNTAVLALALLVARAEVDGVFLSSDKVWGTPVTKDWTHFSGVPATPYENKLKTASQAVAEKHEDRNMLQHALADYPQTVAREALRVLESDTVDRPEKAIGVARWFIQVHEAQEGTLDRRLKRNRLWAAVAKAPTGFCHIRSQVISTLMDDVKAGTPFDDVKAKWDAKMHPLQYQRPTAAPADGELDRAEEIVETLGIRKSFERRFATLDDVLVKLWVPAATEAEPAKAGGLFDALRGSAAKGEVKAVELPAQTMTWVKFLRDVLPGAREIHVQLPAHGNYFATVTATHPDSPPLLQWDGLEGHPRNPVSTYVYHPSSPASRWSLVAGVWQPVTAIFQHPSRWQEPDKFKHQSSNPHASLKDARDTVNKELALFPETLKAELREVRKVIEAYSKKNSLTGGEAASACGILIYRVPLRVRTASGVATYVIDRLE